MNNKKRFKEFEQLGKFMSLFNNETERGASLLAASFIDETLGNILTAFLADIPESINLINDYNAPMGTLYSRASCAYALGLIQKNEYDEINIIRRIRNEFGHHWEDISFENQKIVDLCKNLPWLGPPEWMKIIPNIDLIPQLQFF